MVPDLALSFFLAALGIAGFAFFELMLLGGFL